MTGCTSGFGYGLASLLLDKDFIVVFACRRLDAAQTAIDELLVRVKKGRGVAMKLDLADLESVVAFAKEYEENFTNQGQHLTYLVLNAGVVKLKHDTTKQGVEETYGVNHFGGAALFNVLLHSTLIPSKTRVVAVGSMTHTAATHVKVKEHDLTGNNKDFSTFGHYSASKLFNTLWANHANRLFESKGVSVVSGHPGSGLFTNLGRGDASTFFKIAITPLLYLFTPLAWATGHFQTWHDGGVAELAMCESKEGGIYFDRHRKSVPSAQGSDESLQVWLWEETQRLLQEAAQKHSLPANIALTIE